MHLKVPCAAHVLATFVVASSAWAQEAARQGEPDTPDRRNERVIVKVAGAEREVRGRLLRLDSQTLSIRVDDSSIDLPLERVRRIDVIEHDSLVNGAIFGAIYLAACARWWCGQGTSGAPEIPRDVLLGVGMGALVGAGLDALRNERTTIFVNGRSTGPEPSAVKISFRLRF